MASATDDAVTLWDLTDGTEQTVLQAGAGRSVTSLAFSPCGDRLAAIADDAEIIVWKLQAESVSAVLSRRNEAVTDIAFSADGRYLASIGRGAQITLWELAAGPTYRVFTSPTGAAMTGLAFSPVGSTLAGADEHARITLWDADSGEWTELIAHVDLIKRLRFSPNGNKLASEGLDARLLVWDVASGQDQAALPARSDALVTGLAFSPDGTTLASIGDNSEVLLWSPSSGALTQVLAGHLTPVSALAFGSSGQTLASVSTDGQVIVWDLPAGTERFTSDLPGYPPVASGQPSGAPPLTGGQNDAPQTTVSARSGPAGDARASVSRTQVQGPTSKAAPPGKTARHSRRGWKGITSLTLSPTGARVASSHFGGAVRMWNDGLRELSADAGPDDAPATGVAFTADGKRLVSVSRDSEVRWWDAATGQLRQRSFGHEHPIRTTAASPVGDVVASAGEETRIMVWDAKTGKLTRILNRHSDFVNGLSFSSDGKLLASGGADARVLVWDPATGGVLKTLVGHSGEVNAVAFRRDSTTLASAGADSAVRLWDVASGQQIGVLTGHQAAVRAVVFSRNGKLLASAGEDARILVWDVATGKLLNTLQTNNGAINALLFLPSGRLLSADESGQISEWDVGTFRKLKSVKPSRQPRVQAKALSSLQDGVPALGAFAYDESRDGGSTDAGQHNHGVAADIVGRLLDWLIPAASAATLPDPNLGPGGPILVVTSSSLDGKYGKYYAEILRTEGLNEFSVMDIGSITAVTLSAYDVVILAPATLSADQVTMFGDWVNAGGNLIAMRPAPQLASLLGLTAAGSTLSDRYLLVDTSKAPGAGIVGQSMQFHGTADLYTLNGASSVATLYADATTVTPNPAVTVRSVGGTGGQAAAFAYDLATSIVEMRQGNPAWATEERDGSAPIRSDDKFYGDAATDPQPDWVDLAKVAIPQADEQQRLLANLILYMNLDKKPLPRFWYFPNGKKAVVIMTGDDHGNGGTAGRFDQYLAASPSGCTVANWECVRATSYIYVELPYLSDTEAKSYTDQGFEVGLHLNTNCADYDATSLNAFYSDQVSGFTSAYLSIPAPITQRHHCIAWSDWITGAKTQFNYGMRLDTSYYFWPPGWVQDRPGVFTGSAMPMRFADLDGTIIDVYNTTTQMTDESGQTYPNTSDVLLSAALGPQGYYGAYTVNAHTDLASNPVSDAVVASALGRGVPIVSSRQMMDWLDFRNSSSFQGLGWSGNSLSFNVAPGIATQDIPAAGLQVLLPVNSTAGLLADITRDGASIPYANETVKGVAYAAFPGAAGAYVATYGVDTTPPTMTATSPANGATGVFAGTTVTATFSEAVDAATVSSATVTLQGPSGAVGAAVSYNAATS
ncbi:MAG: Ig-like domain-containing protein, partial [Chromatiaceae bacterium]|nr:Ig-like domain-containing protein [Chromatiaceae bacterium]MBP8289850.1 Ig-like domain-containing protein [Chromatiaceae bacterium]